MKVSIQLEVQQLAEAKELLAAIEANRFAARWAIGVLVLVVVAFGLALLWLSR